MTRKPHYKENPKAYSLLNQTYNAHNGGKLSFLSKAFQESARQFRRERFIKEYDYQIGHMLNLLLLNIDIIDNEFIVAFGKDSFLLTNMRLFPYHKGIPYNDKKFIWLSEIDGIKSTQKRTIEIILKSGEKIILEVRLVPKIEYVFALRDHFGNM